MKRLLFLAGLIVAIGSIGGNILTVHAQTTSTLTPAQTVMFEQELAVAKATLVNLEQQAGMVPAGDSGTATAVTAQPVTVVAPPVVVVTPSAPATSGLTASEASAFQSTLGTLAATLTQLNGSLAANSTLTAAQQQAVQGTLNGMQSTLVAMAAGVSGGSNVAGSASVPIAAAQPSSAPVAVNSAPATPTAAPTVAAATPVVTAAQPAPVANTTAPQTAQVSSFWSFTKAHWPTIVIVLLVIAILAILFWPEKEKVRTVSMGSSGSGKPKSAPTPTTTATLSQNIVFNPAVTKPTMSNGNDAHAPATPVASAVAAPLQK